MSENNLVFKHFEDLWNKSEEIAIHIHKDISSTDVLDHVKVLIENYQDLLTNEAIPNEVVASLKNRYLGEIVFLLTTISARDNVNVYASLMEELRLIS